MTGTMVTVTHLVIISSTVYVIVIHLVISSMVAVTHL